MTKRKKHAVPDETAEAPEKPAEETPAGAGDAPSEADELRGRVLELEDKWLRAVADLDNFRKRTARDREREIRVAREGVVLPILDVLDDLDRALHDADHDGDAFRQGVRMIREKFVTVLGGIGVQGFDSVGEPFDPERHHALQQIPFEGIPEGHVAAEIRRGYVSGERVLRPALVAVAGPAPEAENASAGAESKEESQEDR
jgi:molecular chaperone GrpE